MRVLPEGVEKARKVELLGPRRRSRAIAKATRSARSRVSYADGRRRILVANSDGLLTEDDQVRTRFMVNCVAVGDTGMQTGMEAPGFTVGFEFFDEHTPEDIARIAAARALSKLERPARAERQGSRRAQARGRWRALPRGVRPRARGGPGGPRCLGVPRSGR